jgi:hypothetical protein
MATRLTNFPNGITCGGGNQRHSLAGVELKLIATFDPTSSTQVLLGTLPIGAIPMDVVSFGGGTGGTNPTVDIGTSGTTDLFANELRADVTRSAIASTTAGTGLGTQLTAATPVYGKVGGSAATGGTVKVAIRFVVLPV